MYSFYCGQTWILCCQSHTVCVSAHAGEGGADFHDFPPLPLVPMLIVPQDLGGGVALGEEEGRQVHVGLSSPITRFLNYSRGLIVGVLGGSRLLMLQPESSYLFSGSVAILCFY